MREAGFTEQRIPPALGSGRITGRYKPFKSLRRTKVLEFTLDCRIGPKTSVGQIATTSSPVFFENSQASLSASLGFKATAALEDTKGVRSKSELELKKSDQVKKKSFERRSFIREEATKPPAPVTQTTLRAFSTTVDAIEL
ncbi:hypothetical protein G4B88_016126 [Cannabis sativa]|uniref:Uncharacterized protein n=1 Tax=Cannabis sativa TaxID=3483 RepID=A0A7J6FH29_CANSA|nr:hypothetical protein G4B88_016126 [Cannabis sativa]